MCFFLIESGYFFINLFINFHPLISISITKIRLMSKQYRNKNKYIIKLYVIINLKFSSFYTT